MPMDLSQTVLFVFILIGSRMSEISSSGGNELQDLSFAVPPNFLWCVNQGIIHASEKI